MRRVLFFLLCVYVPSLAWGASVSSHPFEACEDCAKKGWKLPGGKDEVYLGQPSPDQEFLAVIVGSGKEGDGHAVFVVRGGCEEDSLQFAQLTRSAPFAEVPDKMPGEFVRLEWSANGTYLFALGTMYRVTPGEGNAFTVTTMRDLEATYIDFRFGPGNHAVGVEFLSAGRQKTHADGQMGFAVRTDYRIISLRTPRDSKIEKREKAAYFWIPRNMKGRPMVSWDDEGAIIFYTPHERYVERLKLPASRSEVKDGMPEERVWASRGSWVGPCESKWELKTDKNTLRVRLKD